MIYFGQFLVYELQPLIVSFWSLKCVSLTKNPLPGTFLLLIYVYIDKKYIL